MMNVLAIRWRIQLAGMLAVTVLVSISMTLAFVETAAAAPAPQVPLDEDRPMSCRTHSCPGYCDVFHNHVAEPEVLLAGESLTVSIGVRAICHGFATPLHIVMVLDVGAPISSSDLRDLKQALAEIIRRLNMPDNPETRVGLVITEARDDIVVQVTNDETRLLRAIHRINAGDTERLSQSMEQGLALLRKARGPNAKCRRPINEIALVIAPEPTVSRCPSWARTARKLSQEGVLVASICATRRCNSRCMSDIASSARYVYDLDTIYGLSQVFDRIRDELINITLRSLHVFEHLPKHLAYVPGSAVPPAELAEDGQRLHWQVNFVPKEGITFTYRTRTLASGNHPTSRGTNVFWRDNQNRCGETQVRPARISVLGLPELAEAQLEAHPEHPRTGSIIERLSQSPMLVRRRP